MEHPAVAEAGVIGESDAIIGELVKAFVTLKQEVEPSDALHLELIGFARTKLGSAVAPKQIEFEANLPKNRAGKIMRRLLKARELGLPEGDISSEEAVAVGVIQGLRPAVAPVSAYRKHGHALARCLHRPSRS